MIAQHRPSGHAAAYSQDNLSCEYSREKPQSTLRLKKGTTGDITLLSTNPEFIAIPYSSSLDLAEQMLRTVIDAHPYNENVRADVIKEPLLQAFSDQFLNSLPIGLGTIEIDEIYEWLERSVCPQESNSLIYVGGTLQPTTSIQRHNHYALRESIEICGFTCRRDSNNKPLFNFTESSAIYITDEPMDWCTTPQALANLGHNILLQFHTLIAPSTQLLTAAIFSHNGCEEFCELFLDSLPEQGGRIGIDSIKDWCEGSNRLFSL